MKAAACAHPKYYLGCRADRATRYAVLDIDAGSKYHNKKALDKLRRILKDAGINQTVLYRSSDSNGWHLYIFFDEPASSKDLRNQLFRLLNLNDFEVAKGKLEIFPHPGDKTSKGQGLRLPLQPGFAWLNQETLEVVYERWELSAAKAVDFFLADLNSSANTRHDFHRMRAHVERLLERKETVLQSVHEPKTLAKVIPINKKQNKPDTQAAEHVIEVFNHWPNNMDPEVWLKGKEYFESGLTGPSQRADAIFCLSHYLFYGDPELGQPALGYGYEQERKWAIEKILLAKHHNQSKDIAHARSDALIQVERASHWVPPARRGQENVRYESKVPIAWKRNSANLKLDARKRITDAVASFVEAKMQFSLRDLAAKSKCAVNTLYKHTDLWKKAQEQARKGYFASDLPEYNAGVGAAVSEQQPPATPLLKIAPPGLLAARQLVYEISMRRKRQQRQNEKLALESKEAQENWWEDKLTLLASERLSEVTTEKLNAILAVGKHYLSIAPNEEVERKISGYIASISKEKVKRARGPTNEF